MWPSDSRKGVKYTFIGLHTSNKHTHTNIIPMTGIGKCFTETEHYSVAELAYSDGLSCCSDVVTWPCMS